MNNELAKQNEGIQGISDYWKTHKKSFDDFSKKIGTKPKQAALKVNKFANNSLYLPIGSVELQLDRMFHGQWSLKVDNVEFMLNAVQVTVTLRVLHPVSGEWLERSGIAAKQVQLAKGKSEFIPENLAAKCLERDVPIAKAEAFKNAAKSLGNTFGRHLNRDFTHDFIEDKEDIFADKS